MLMSFLLCHQRDDFTDRWTSARVFGSCCLMEVLAFFLACENFGRMFDNSFPACSCFFFRWRLFRAN